MGASPPWRLDPSSKFSDNISLINDNFDKVVQDIADFGASATTTVSFNSGSVADGDAFTQQVVLMNPGETHGTFPTINTQKVESKIATVIPRVDIYIDQDLDEDHRWPGGFGTPILGDVVFFSTIVAQFTITGTLRSYTINATNLDGTAHTFYFHADALYLPQEGEGIFR